MSLRRTLAAVAIAAAILTMSATGTATVLEQLSLEEMVERSDAIVHGVVVTSGTRLVLDDTRGAEPHTVTTLRTLRWLKGGDAPTVTIREFGGESQGRAMWISGTPRYEANEEVVLFLERHPERPDEFRTFGMVMGKFAVRHGLGDVPSSIRRDLQGVGVATWGADGEMQVDHASPEPAMHLETFLDFVEDLVRRAGR